MIKLIGMFLGLVLAAFGHDVDHVHSGGCEVNNVSRAFDLGWVQIVQFEFNEDERFQVDIVFDCFAIEFTADGRIITPIEF